MSGVNKIAAERNQRTLLELVNQPGNDVCADCKARTPRWASYNLGIFICMNCASIHRKIGTHITKVKSLTLDSWTKEQVEHMKQVGNVKSNATYNPDETRHPPPANLIDSERDSELEKFVRNKYEFKSYMSRSNVPAPPSGPSVLSSSRSIDRSEIVASLLGPSRSASSKLSRGPSIRRETAPTSNSFTSSTSAKTPPLPPRPAGAAGTASTLPSSVSTGSSVPVLPPRPALETSTQASSSTFSTLQQLNPPRTVDATLPLQVLAQPTTQPIAMPTSTSSFLATNPYPSLSVSPGNPFSAGATQATGISPGNIGRSMSLNSGLSAGIGSGISPFQSPPLDPTMSLASLSNNPSPNPFSPQSLPATGIYPGTLGATGITPGMIGTPGIFSQPQTPFGTSVSVPQSQIPFGAPASTTQSQTLFGAPGSLPQAHTPFGAPAPASSPFLTQQPMQSTTSLFQPQPQLQVPMTGTSFAPSQSPGTPFTGPQYGSTPSPFSAAQVQGQPMQQPMQQGFGTANPFTSWVQQPPGQQGGWGGAM